MCVRATSGCTTSSGCRCRSRVSGRLWVARRWWPHCDPPPPTSHPARGRRTRSAAWKSRLQTASSTSSLSIWQVGGGGRTLKTWIVSATRWCQKHSKPTKNNKESWDLWLKMCFMSREHLLRLEVQKLLPSDKLSCISANRCWKMVCMCGHNDCDVATLL